MPITHAQVALLAASASGTTAFTSYFSAGGYLEAIRLARPTTGQIASGGSLTITDDFGLTLFAATATSTGSQTWYPRARVVDASGLPIGFSSDNTPPNIIDKIPVPANSRIKTVVASGGANGIGTLHFYISGA